MPSVCALQAMVLINDLELVDNAEFFETRLKAGGVLDVAEKYPWTGETVLLDSPTLTMGLVHEPEATSRTPDTSGPSHINDHHLSPTFCLRQLGYRCCPGSAQTAR